MKKLGVMFLALLMALTACLPGFAAGAGGMMDSTTRNAELSAFTDGAGHIYISGLGSPVNATLAKEIVSIDPYRILFLAQENVAAGIPATRLIALALDTMEETVITDEAADACVVGDHAYYIPVSDPMKVLRYALDTGASELACESKEPVERLYAVSEGAVAVLSGGISAYAIDMDGYTVYNREIAQEYAVFEGFDVYTTADGSLYAHTGTESVLLDSNVAAWAVLQDKVYYLTQNSGLLSLKAYDPLAGLWRVILPVCQFMQPQLTASQSLLFMLSRDNTVYTVDPESGAMTKHTALPAMDSYTLENGAKIESYRIEAVSGQLNVLGLVRQAAEAPAFTFVQYAEQTVETETMYRLLSAYVIQNEDTVYALLQPAEQYTLLQYGSRGEAVSAIQDPLLKLGYYDYRVDGIFGWRTEDAIELLQADLGLAVTGAADADLQKLILSGTLEAYNPYRALAKGDRGSRVLTMQQRLRKLGYLADGADAIFGSRTQAAVSLFQRENNLRETGVADEGTLKLLYSKAASACSVYIELVRGDSGYRVRELNDRLKKLYYLEGSTGSNYTSATISAVRKFQTVAGLKQTGIATPEVQKALFDKKAPENPDFITLRRGDDNERVKQMQNRLNDLGYHAGVADGSYGKNTQIAVKLFQRIAGLKATGTADVETLRRLFAKDAPEYKEPEKIGVPVVSVEGYTAVENGVYVIDDTISTVLLNWYADGDVASYSIRISDANGAVLAEESAVTSEMMSLPVEGIVPGMLYTLTVTAHPQENANDSATAAELSFMRAVQPEEPEAAITSLVILPAGSYESADGYLVFNADAALAWGATGEVFGYTWRVTDADGDVMAGYANDNISVTDSVELKAADFPAGNVYTLTVEVYSPVDTAPALTESLSFSFAAPQQDEEPGDDQPGEEDNAEDTKTDDENQSSSGQPGDGQTNEGESSTDAPAGENQNGETEGENQSGATEGETYVVIDMSVWPEGDHPLTEAGYLLSEDTTFRWQVTGNPYGYAYRIFDPNGNGVTGYESQELTKEESLTIREADFALDATYTLTLYAFEDPAVQPMVLSVPFVYPSDLNAPAGGDVVDEPENIQPVDRRALYQDFYSRYCTMEEGVVLADVTGDGKAEMIVKRVGGQTIEGYVYTVDETTATVVQIDTVVMMPAHAGGTVGWYLVPNGESWALVEETDNMWQGYGEASFMKYVLSENGERIALDSGWITDQEPACVDADGRLLDFLIDEFGGMVADAISPGYVIYRSNSLARLTMDVLYMEAHDTLYGEVGVVSVGLSSLEDSGEDNGISGEVVENIGGAADTVIDAMEDAIADATDDSSEIAENIGGAADTVIDAMEEAIADATDDGSEIAENIGGAVDGMIEMTEDMLEQMPDPGLIKLLNMTYSEISNELSGLNWFDSMDNLGVWFADGYYATENGDVSVYFEFYEDPASGTAYPGGMTVMDFNNAGAWVTDQLRTGMTYAEVRALQWESIGDMQAVEDGTGVVDAYPEQGCSMTLVFDSASDNAVLTTVMIMYFE